MFESCLHSMLADLRERGGVKWAGLDSVYRELNTTMTTVFYGLHETMHQKKPFSLHSSSVALKMIYQ